MGPAVDKDDHLCVGVALLGVVDLGSGGQDGSGKAKLPICVLYDSPPRIWPAAGCPSYGLPISLVRRSGPVISLGNAPQPTAITGGDQLDGLQRQYNVHRRFLAKFAARLRHPQVDSTRQEADCVAARAGASKFPRTSAPAWPPVLTATQDGRHGRLPASRLR